MPFASSRVRSKGNSATDWSGLEGCAQAERGCALARAALRGKRAGTAAAARASAG
jgi:hypothetical protein